MGIFGGIMGGVGGGVGGVGDGHDRGEHAPPVARFRGAGWSVIVAAYAGARFTLRRVAKSKRVKLHEIATQIANQIAESTASSEPTDAGDCRLAGARTAADAGDGDGKEDRA